MILFISSHIVNSSSFMVSFIMSFLPNPYIPHIISSYLAILSHVTIPLRPYLIMPHPRSSFHWLLILSRHASLIALLLSYLIMPLPTLSFSLDIISSCSSFLSHCSYHILSYHASYYLVISLLSYHASHLLSYHAFYKNLVIPSDLISSCSSYLSHCSYVM